MKTFLVATGMVLMLPMGHVWAGGCSSLDSPKDRLADCTKHINSGEYDDREYRASMLSLAYGIRGSAWDAIGEFDRAIEDYDQAIFYSENAYYYAKRGSVYRRMGDMKRAVADYNLAVKIDRKNHNVWLETATYNILNGYNDTALENIERALELMDEQGKESGVHSGRGRDAHLLRSLVYALKGDRKQALQEVDKAFVEYEEKNLTKGIVADDLYKDVLAATMHLTGYCVDSHANEIIGKETSPAYTEMMDVAKVVLAECDWSITGEADSYWPKEAE